MAEELEDDEGAVPSGGGSNRNIIIAGLITAAWLGGGLGFFFANRHGGGEGGGGGHGAAHGEAGGGEGHGEGSEGGGGGGGGDEHVVTMASFVANMTPDMEGEMHYLKCTLAVALASEAAEKAFEQRTPRIRSQILMYLSNLKVADVQGIENKRKLVAHLLDLVNESMGPKAVTDLYLTEFVIQ